MTVRRHRPYRDLPIHDHSWEAFALLAVFIPVFWVAATSFAQAIEVKAEPAPTTRHYCTENVNRNHGLLPYSDCP